MFATLLASLSLAVSGAPSIATYCPIDWLGEANGCQSSTLYVRHNRLGVWLPGRTLLMWRGIHVVNLRRGAVTVYVH